MIRSVPSCFHGISARVVASMLFFGIITGALSPSSWAASKTRQLRPSAMGQAAVKYAEAIGQGDADRFGRLDFACQYRSLPSRQASPKSEGASPLPSLRACLDGLKPAHAEAISQKEEGMNVLWPGKGRVIFFTKPPDQYPASAFVMDLIGQSPPGSGFTVQYGGEQQIPQASFPSADGRRTVSVPTALVQIKVSYKDPLTAPVSYAPGTFQWTSTVPRPRIAIRSVSLQFVVMSGLRRHGYSEDVAVVNIPVSTVSYDEGALRQAIPFTTEASRAVEGSLEAWRPGDMPGLLIAAVARSHHYPELADRVALLNRVLLIDPQQLEALTSLTNELYRRILFTGDAAPPPLTKDASLTRRLAELSWNWYAQTARTDLSLGMEMGGFAKPTPADFLYRMLPAMEMLRQVRPQDLDNRLHLGIAYRWNNDQSNAIQTHEALVNELAAARPDQRARVLIELAWSRINKVAWNRILDDPDIQQAYREAEQAFKLTEDPLDKFTAAYTMAYSQIFMPQRDIQLMFDNLTEAKQWFDQTPGATPAAWHFAIGRETLKAVLDSNPTFKPLLASSEPRKE